MRDDGPHQNTNTAADTWRLKVGDIFQISPDRKGKLILKDGSTPKNVHLRDRVTGLSEVDPDNPYAEQVEVILKPVSIVVQESLTFTVSGVLELHDPKVKDNVVIGSGSASFTVAGPSGSAVVNKSAVIERVF